VAKKPAGGTPATVALDRAGVAFTLHPYEHDPRAASYGLEAAEALGLAPARVFKTLMASLDPSTGSGRRGALVVGIVPVTGQLDLKALARALGGSRASMAELAVAERATGYVAGGISPIGQKRVHPTVLDQSALAFPTIFVSGGRRGLDIELAPEDVVRVTGAVVAGIGR
jgi:Cys-tRNA(Pro)/Cys-tRNA(Cys) deacylase